MSQVSVINQIQNEFDKSFVTRFNQRRSDKGMKWAEERTYALQIIAASEMLQKCSINSIKVALSTVASMGLSLNPERRHAYLIPRRPAKGKPYQCLATPSYLGLEYLARQLPEIANIQTELVCENDHVFETWIDIDGPHFKHSIARKDRGDVTHAYCVTWFSNGTRILEVMDREDLDQIKKAAIAAMNGTVPPSWRYYEREMQKKCVTRRASKHWPISSRTFERALAAMDKADPVDLDQPSGLLMSTRQADGIRSLLKDSNMDVEVEVKNICAAYNVDELGDILSDEVTSIRRGIQQRAKAREALA